MRNQSATLTNDKEADGTQLIKVVTRGGANCVQEQFETLQKQKPQSIQQFLIFSMCDYTVFEPVTSTILYKKLYRLIKQTDFPEEAKLTEMTSSIKKMLKQGRTLKELARLVVRERLGGKVLHNASKLGLPSSLEEYVTYSECTQV